jgi:predicted transcriptional regulator
MQQETKEIVASGKNALELADALNATTLRILQILRKERLDVSTIAKRLELSEAYISEQLRSLEDLNLVNVTYARGKRGVRKLCDSSIERVIIVLNDEDGNSTPRE